MHYTSTPKTTSDYIGVIAEFTNSFISLCIEDIDNNHGFSIKVGPSTIDEVFIVSWNGQKFGASHKQAKEHLLTAIEIARISTYAPTHRIRLSIPFHPLIVIPVTDIEKAITILKKALDSYF